MRNKLGSGCLVLFALPFAGVGVLMAVLVVRTLRDWKDAQAWVETPATILEANLEEHHKDNSTTYEATARYAYQYAGQEYQGTRVALTSGSDNLGAFQQNRAHELKAYQAAGKPFRCFVNPNDPNQALLYRGLRMGILVLELVMGLVFGGVGIVALVAAVLAGRRSKKRAQKKQQFPGQPWMLREDWAAGVVRSSSKTAARSVLLFALLWNLICWPIFFIFLFSEVRAQQPWAWIVAIFPAIGIGLALWAGYLVHRCCKWGESSFEMAAVPGVVGGVMAGVVHAPGGLRPEEGYLLTLSCIRRVRRGSGDNSSTHDEILWQDEKVIAHELMAAEGSQTVIPVQFHVPYDAPETGTGKNTFWQLDASAQVPGVDYHATFIVPIYKTEASSPEAPVDEDALAPYEAPASLESVLRRNGIRLEQPTAHHRRLVFSMARNWGVALATTLFGAAWTAICVALFYSDAPILLPIVFSLFEVLIVGFALDLWLGKSTVEIEDGVLRFQGGLLGWGRARRFTAQQVRKIAVKQGMQSGTKLYYLLELETTEDKKYRLGKGIRRKSDAQRLATEILAWLDPSASG